MPTTWRSPQRVPRPPRTDEHPPPSEPLQRLAFGGAWRHRAFAGALANGLRRAPFESQRDVLEAIARALEASDAFLEAARSVGVTDAATRVEARLAEEPVPNAESWAELAVADVVMAGALRDSAAALGHSAAAGGHSAGAGGHSAAAGGHSAAAGGHSAAAGGHSAAAGGGSLRAAAARACAPSFGPGALDALASDAPNRACLQLLVDRWLPAAVACFGRPGSEGEMALLEDGAKTVAASEAAASFLRRLGDDLASRALSLPVANRLGLIVSEYPLARRTAR